LANCTGANTIVAFAAAYGCTPANNPVTGFSDSNANTYTAPIFIGQDLNGFGLWYATATGATGAASMLVLVATVVNSPAITIVAAAYNITACPGIGSTSGAVATGNGTGVQGPATGGVGFAALIIGLISGPPSSNSKFSPGPGFTAASSFTSAGINAALLIEHQIVSTTGTYAAPTFMSPPGNWAVITLALPDNSQPVRSSQTAPPSLLGASGGPVPIGGIPPNMSVLAAMSAGILPGNVVVTGGSLVAGLASQTLLHQLSSIGIVVIRPEVTTPQSKIAATAANQLQIGTPPVFGG
jgi:hypothetical protein